MLNCPIFLRQTSKSISDYKHTLMAYGSEVLLPPLDSFADCFSALRHSFKASLCSLSFASNLGVFPSLFFNIDGQPV